MSKKNKTSEVVSSLYKAFDFIKSAQRENGVPFMCHSKIKDGFVYATDGILTMCHPVEEELEAYPNTFQILAALSECGASLAITQLSADRISIKSDKIHAFVSCVPNDSLDLISEPDIVTHNISDALKKGFEVCKHLVSEGSLDILTGSLSIASGTCTSTNRKAMVQYYHGLDLPKLSIPKQTVNFCVDCKLEMKSFGFSETSITIYFENGAWIKSQIFEQNWPEIDHLFKNITGSEYPQDFFKAIKAAKKFSKDGHVYFSKDKISSHPIHHKQGIAYDVIGVENNFKYQIADFEIVQKLSNKIAFDKDGYGYFYGANTRGVIFGAGY